MKKLLDPTKDIAKAALKGLIMQKFNVSERTADTRINALYALLDAHEIKIWARHSFATASVLMRRPLISILTTTQRLKSGALQSRSRNQKTFLRSSLSVDRS